MARILIVDDSPTEMYKLTGMLEKHGHVVLKAENGADGVALARQEKPDVVLMDIVDAGPQRLSGDASAHKRSGNRQHPGDRRDDQGSGNRHGLGPAPGCQGLPDQTGG